MTRNARLFDQVLDDLRREADSVSDKDVATEALAKLSQGKHGWQDLSMFWPPRLVAAMEEGHLTPFLGAGVSIAAGIASWAELLRSHLRLTKAYIEDKDLENDPLTMAEIASQRSGAAFIQATLRDLTARAARPTTSHLVLASLRCQIYVTTNYDTLLEKAWVKVSNGGQMRVVVNDADLLAIGPSWVDYNDPNQPLLFKIHGCIERNGEQLILTRHDYRHHYRANKRFFDAVRQILQSRHILFAGFSHRDPEVTRLVEDAIYEYERERDQATTPSRPNFYSLQFDMLEHTPEIFAAKGLVALRPPFYPAAAHGKALSLCVALGELAHAQQAQSYAQVAIDGDLHSLASKLSEQIEQAFEKMNTRMNDLLAALASGSGLDCCRQLMEGIGPLASQGVYLLDQQGRVCECSVPAGLSREDRMKHMPTFFDRPYFRIAKSFREPYVSDSFESKFNAHATIALCIPLLEGLTFKGLVFSAAQVGPWVWPINAATEQWSKGRSMILIDSNGIALLPPNNEVALKNGNLLISTEDPAVNLGYRYKDLFALSRRDSLVKHLVENIVPLSQDDDVFEISSDFEYYSVVTEIPKTRWKLAIAQPVEKT